MANFIYCGEFYISYFNQCFLISCLCLSYPFITCISHTSRYSNEERLSIPQNKNNNNCFYLRTTAPQFQCSILCTTTRIYQSHDLNEAHDETAKKTH